MNTLLLYDSAFGNTGELARAMAGRLGEYGTVRLFHVPEIQHIPHLEHVDVVIIGGPTHKHGLSSTMQAFLKGLPAGTFRELRAAAFDTRYHIPAWKSGSAAPKIARRLKKDGAVLLASPKSFFVIQKEGPLEQREVREAVRWVEEIFQTFEAQREMARLV